MPSKTWNTYEEVAQYLLNQFAEYFELGRVEGKQIVPGKSGTEWEIDAKGVKADGEGFLIVECRRYTKVPLESRKHGSLGFSYPGYGSTRWHYGKSA